MNYIWHSLSKSAVLESFGVDAAWGLSKERVQEQFKIFGSNTIEKEQTSSALTTLFKQFKSPLVFILIAAFLGALYLQETVDAVVILIALLVNVSIGFFQEYRAQNAFLALTRSNEHEVVVQRDGERVVIHSQDVVPGDIMLLEAGGLVTADAYLLESSDLSVSEAHLTGESAPLDKSVGTLKTDAPVYERTNMVFSGSPILSGSARAIAVNTGSHAEIGSIAHSLENYSGGDTPIEKSVQRLARFLSVIVGIVIVVLLIFGTLRGIPLSEIVILAIALAVSVVPEGLPAAVTAILAIGMEQILKKKGLVRNLLAAETLGSTTIILTDKTGTLTQAHMQVVDVVTGLDRGFSTGALSSDQRFVLKSALFVSDAFLTNGGKETYGRPIERAVASAAFDSDVLEGDVQYKERQLDFLKFSSSRRFAAALYEQQGGEKTQLYFSGAPEILIAEASQYYQEGKAHDLTKEKQQELLQTLRSLAEEGKRVIGISYREGSAHSINRKNDALELPKGATFVGIIAFADPAREDVPQAIKEVREAGVRVVMVTGDTPETAKNIAVQVGIAGEKDETRTGHDIEALSDEELYEALMKVPVFARVLPHQKQRLVTVLQSHEEVVAMTGDGVNDAPALSSAQIGIAVGSGTEVAREASDLVLLDNSFSIIVAAIQEGRRILDNIKKAITHLITTSFHEVFIIAFAVIAGLPLPVLPVQILWVNILEEGFLTFGYAFEPHEKNIMKRDPRSARMRTALTREVKRLILLAGTVTGLFSIALFLWLLSRELPIEEIRTIMFVVLSLDALFFAISLKNLHRPVWTANLFNNHYLIFALGLSALGIVLTLTVPLLRELLSLTVPNTFDILVLIAVALVNIATIEIAKKFAFRDNVKIAT